MLFNEVLAIVREDELIVFNLDRSFGGACIVGIL